MTQRRVLGSEAAVRAFRARAATPALEDVEPQAKFAVRPWCDERPGPVSCEDGDHRIRERATTTGRAIDNCPMCKG